jgi:hypothetical protein
MNIPFSGLKSLVPHNMLPIPTRIIGAPVMAYKTGGLVKGVNNLKFLKKKSKK